jgi:DNA polymerase III subunit epsilon
MVKHEPFNRKVHLWALPSIWIDVETSGLDSNTDRVLEVAAAHVSSDGAVIESFSTLVNPHDGFEVPEESAAIHGITTASLQEAPSFSDVWPRILAMAPHGQGYAGAYNAGFDRGFIRAEAARAGLSTEAVPYSMRYPWIDPLVWVREIDRYAKGKGRHKLTVTCERWGIPLVDAHTANADILAAVALWTSQRMGQELGRRCQETPLSLLRVQMEQERLAEGQERRHQEFVASAPTNSACASCGAAVIWTITETGQRAPIDAEPHEAGTIFISPGSPPVSSVLTGSTLIAAISDKAKLHRSHFATCPNAAAHRAPKRPA